MFAAAAAFVLLAASPFSHRAGNKTVKVVRIRIKGPGGAGIVLGRSYMPGTIRLPKITLRSNTLTQLAGAL
jgi:hypothetical protein